ENGSRSRQAPGRRARAGCGLDGPGHETALAPQEEKRHDTHERRQDDGQRDERADRAAAGELRALEEEREGNADRGRERDRGERDPEGSPERAPLVGSARELGEPSRGEVRRAQRFAGRQDERVGHEPGQQQDERGARDRPRLQISSRGYTRGAGPAGAGMTPTFWPTWRAREGASTSTSPAPSRRTRKSAVGPA